MVGPTRQGSVKQRIVAEKGTKRRRPNGGRRPAFGRIEDMKRCIATEPELWFERPGFPSGSAPRAPRSPPRNVSFGGRPRSTRRPRLRPAERRAADASEPHSKEQRATMLMLKPLTVLAVTIFAVLVGGGAALADLGQPSPWQFGFQQAVTPVMDRIVWFHDFLLYIITGIAGFVLVLLIIVMVRFNARANPIASRTTHNTFVEIAWTIIPIAILMVIAVPSFKLLFLQLNIPAADLTVKATGNQWYWTYSYPDNGPFQFDSLMLKEGQRKPDQPRLLAVDNEMVVPVNKTVRVITTGSDVIHSFAVPSFGIKIDAVPGR